MRWLGLGEFGPWLVAIAVDVLTICSSAVLWISQNMEDEYSYNLAL